jgi:DNA-directed RNA polymerase subunit RPC12/RpoP
MNAFSEAFTKDPVQFLRLLDFGDFWYSMEPIGTNYTRKLLKYANITPQLYTEIIDDMHYLGIVKSYQTDYICQVCDIDNPILLRTKYNLRIQQAEEITCPRCGEFMDFFSIFKIDKILSTFILSRDGLLSVYAAWLFDIYRLSWEYSTYPGKSECDFELKIEDTSFIIEVKMLSIPDMDSDWWNAFEKKLIAGLKQLVDKIKDQKGKTQGILLVNLKKKYFKKNLGTIVSKYLKKRRLSPKKYKIKILPYDQLQNFIDGKQKLLPS